MKSVIEEIMSLKFVMGKKKSNVWEQMYKKIKIEEQMS